MLEQQGILGLIAIGLGFILGFLLFVPFVWLSYRRRGGITGTRIAIWTSALIYFLAIWTYTLLPLPDPTTLQCAGTNLDPTLFVTEIREAIAEAGGSLRALLTNAAILQLALNVLLFVPLGFFLRILFRRGWITSILVGAGISLFIETTQLTGVWGLYSCAYRVFDVNDMMTNTTGALLGSLLALMIPLRWRSPGVELPPETPRPVTKGRRLLAMVTNLVAFSIVLSALTILTRVIIGIGMGREDLAYETPIASHIAVAVTLGLWVVLTLGTGRTVGDHTVRLAYRGGALPQILARVLRLLGGVGIYGVILLLPGKWSGYSTLFCLIALLFALFTRNGRGLPGLLSGQKLVDDREDSSEA